MILRDLAIYIRNIELRIRFKDSDQEKTDFTVPNPEYCPKVDLGEKLKTYCNSLKDKFEEEFAKYHSVNDVLPWRLTKALRGLKQDKTIVIKKADKNLGFVVLDREWDVAECLRILSDDMVYQTVTTPPSFPSLFQSMYDILDTHNALFEEHTNPEDKIFTSAAKFILQDARDEKLGKVEFCNFYTLPKIHKEPLSGRPINPTIHFVTYYASKFLDRKLKSIMEMAPSFIGSSTDLLRTLQKSRFPPECVLVTADIRAMYPSIPIEDGVLAVERMVKRFCNCIGSTIKESEIPLVVDLLRFVMTSTYLKYKEQVYRQVKGTAMGTPAAVPYASIFVMDIELTLFETRLKINPSPEYRSALFRDNERTWQTDWVLLYKRFIDDLKAIFRNMADAIHFMKQLSSMHPAIQFDVKMADDKIEFLDVDIFKGPNFARTGILSSRLFQKPLNAFCISILHQHIQSMSSGLSSQNASKQRGSVAARMKIFNEQKCCSGID